MVRTDGALHSQDDHLRRLIETAPIGYAYHQVITDAAGRAVDYRFLEVNHAFEELTGLSAERIVGRTLREIDGVAANNGPDAEASAADGANTIAEADRSPVAAGFGWVKHFDRLAVDGGTTAIELFSPATKRWFLVHARSSSPGFFATVFVDITDRVATERALHDDRRRFELAIDGTGAGLWDWNIVEDTAYLSPRWKTMLGYNVDDLPNAVSTWKRLWHPDDAERIESAIADHLKGTTAVFEIEHRLRAKDGSWRWILTRGDLIRDIAGTPIRWVGTNIDRTANRRLAEELARNRQYLTSVIETQQDLISRFLPDTTLTFVNDAYCRFFQRSRKELIGRRFVDDYPAEARAALLGKLREMSAALPTRNYSRTYRLPDGSEVWLEWADQVVLDADSRVVEFQSLGRDITDRKRVESELRETERQFLDVVYSSEEAIVLIGHHEFYDCNDTHARRLGYESRAEFLAVPLREVWPETQTDGQKTIEKVVQMTQVAGKRGMHSFELELFKRNGVPFLAEITFTPIVFKGRNLIYCTWRDITTRKAEQRWALLQAAFQKTVADTAASLLRSSPENSATVIEKTLAQFVTLFGTDRGYVFRVEPGGETMSMGHEWCGPQISPQRDRMQQRAAGAFPWWRSRMLERVPLHIPIIDQLPNAAKALRQELTTQETVPILNIPMFNEQNQWVGVLGFDSVVHAKEWTDTEISMAQVVAEIVASANSRNRALIELQNSRERYKSLSENSPVAVFQFVVPPNQTPFFRYASEKLETFTGVPIHEIYSDYRNFRDRIAEDYRSSFDDEIALSALGLTEFSHRFPVRNGDGDFWLEVRAVPERDSGGGTVWNGVFIDINERVVAEQKIIDFAEMVEQNNVTLDEALETAKQAGIAKSSFLANMSHEIRTPMNAVIGMTNLLLDTSLTHEQQRYVETIKSGGESLLGLINDILDFSKIEAGKLDIEMIDFDLLNLLEDFVSALAFRAEEKSLELVYAIDAAVPLLVKGDPGRLRQILTNLVGNAIKFTETGEVAVFVHVETDLGDQVLLRFEVADTGIGIPPDRINSLFQLFSQVDTSTTRKFGGTGLGLAISKQLATLMGGSIGVTAKLGEGSQFWFTARFVKQPVAAKRPVGLHSDPTGGSLPEALRVLIVDDNATNRRVLCEQVASWPVVAGSETAPLAVAGRPVVDSASDGSTALTKLYAAHAEGKPFTVVVIDFAMPGMNGDVLGRVIKADPKLSSTVTILMVPIAGADAGGRSTELGFWATLTKPVRLHELRRALVTIAGATPVGSHPPLTAVQSTGSHAAPEEPRPGQRARVGGQAARVLLVEDNHTNQLVAIGMLSKLGLRVDAVTDGAQALKAIANNQYDLVFMDCQMPVMDGYEATRAIRSLPATDPNRQIPIVAMTAHAMQGDREKCLACGMNDYVSKPISQHALAGTLERWLQRNADAAVDYDQSGAAGTSETADPVEPNDPDAWRPAELRERMMDDDDLVHTVLAAFTAETPVQLQRLRTFLERDDLQSAAHIAHSIKGAAANVGATTLNQCSAALEAKTKRGDAVGVIQLISDMEESFSLVEKTMVQYLRRDS